MQILTAIFVAFVGQVLIELIFKGLDKQSPLLSFIKWANSRSWTLKPIDNTKPLSTSVKDLIKSYFIFIKNDLETSGHFKGQFGKYQRKEEESRYISGKENIDIKPRLYLTGVPTFILKKHDDSFNLKNIFSQVREGMQLLFKDSYVFVAVGAMHYTNPTSKSHKMISFRHTIRAAQILLEIAENKKDMALPLVVLGRMLDSNLDLQTESGGWRQCNIEFTDEDLWVSAYSAGFLFSVMERAKELSLKPDTIVLVDSSLNRTLVWLEDEWKKNQWGYGKVKSIENAPILFCVVANPIIIKKPAFASLIISEFKRYVDATGQPKEHYLNELTVIGKYSASVRLAYTLFLVKDSMELQDNPWQTLANFAESNKNEGYSSSDAAMMLDMHMFVNSENIVNPITATGK
jgi:hypothetical protein